MIKPLDDISGRTALPASVISPNRSILRHLSLLSSDQLLLGFRGQSFWAVTSSAIFLNVLKFIFRFNSYCGDSKINKCIPGDVVILKLTTG